jgi:hypothetical protein
MYGIWAIVQSLYDTFVSVNRQILSYLPSKHSLLVCVRGENLPKRESLPSQTE